MELCADSKAIFGAVQALACRVFNVDHQMIQSGATFNDIPGADSLRRIEFILQVEENFVVLNGKAVSIPDEDIDRLDTFGDLVKYLVEHGACSEKKPEVLRAMIRPSLWREPLISA